MPVKAPYAQPLFDWTGLYIGGHTGYGRGHSSAVLWDPAPTSQSGNFSGVIGGVQGGYNLRLPSGLLLGVEADLTFPNYITSNSITSRIATPRNDFVEQWDYVGTLRGRLGYAQRHWLLYATGGLAYAGERFINVPDAGVDEKHIGVRLGWAAGAGFEYAFAPHWTVRLEYLYSQFGRANVTLLPSGVQHTSTLDFQSLRIGLNRKIDLPGSPGWKPKTDITDPEFEPLGDPRPDHLSAAGLSGVSRAVHRHQQPHAGAAGESDLEQRPLSQHAALGRRRGLLQSRTAAGLWPERHRRASRASRTARRKNPTSPTRITTPRGCSSARPLASAANRRNCRAARCSSPTRSTSTG